MLSKLKRKSVKSVSESWREHIDSRGNEQNPHSVISQSKLSAFVHPGIGLLGFRSDKFSSPQ